MSGLARWHAQSKQSKMLINILQADPYFTVSQLITKVIVISCPLSGGPLFNLLSGEFLSLPA